MNRMWRSKAKKVLQGAYPQTGGQFKDEDAVVALMREAYVAGMQRAAKLAPGVASPSNLRTRIRQVADEEPDW